MDEQVKHKAGVNDLDCMGVDFYSCEEAVRRLNEYLDHELNEAESAVVLKHLELCRPCLRRFTFEKTLIVSLRQKITVHCMPFTLRRSCTGFCTSANIDNMIR